MPATSRAAGGARREAAVARSRRRTGCALALVASVLVGGIGATAGAQTSSTTTTALGPGRDRTGVTATTLTVGGIVGTDPRSVGADVGAQARLLRANRTRELHGRTLRYLRTEPVTDAPSADAAAARLASEVFAVVPAVGPSVGAAALAGAGVPFFGDASTVEWYANRTGFGVTGAAVSERTRIARSPLGVLLRGALGGVSAPVAVLHDDDPAGAVRAAEAQRSLRAAGFRSVDVIGVPPAPAPLDTAALAARPPTGVDVFLTGTDRTLALVGALVAAASTATMVVGSELYSPSAPAAASGLTVLTSVAPFEQATAANRRLAADVEAFAPGTVLTPAIAAGYWSADLFIRGLLAVGGRPTRTAVLAAMNGEHFTYSVPATVGASAWPEMHTQPVPCGALSQSDGTQFVVVAPYRCAPAARPR